MHILYDKKKAKVMDLSLSEKELNGIGTKIRGKIRRELNNIIGWKNPTPDRILKRWDSRLSDVFSILPHQFRDDLQKMLSKKIKKRK